MTSSQIEKMQKELSAVLNKYGVVTKNNARYSDTEVRVSMSVAIKQKGTTPTADTELPCSGNYPSDSVLRTGRAYVGDYALVRNEPVVIMKTMRKNYSFRFLSRPSKGYKAPFSMFEHMEGKMKTA